MAKSRIAISFEYWALRAFCALANAIPYPLALAVARTLGSFAFRVVRFKRARTLARIRSVFPEASEAEARRIAIRSIQGLLMTAVEMMRAHRIDRAWVERYVVEAARYKEVLQRVLDEGKGVVIMVPHCGNWYMAAWAMAKLGVRIFAIAARQRNPKLNAWMTRQYGEIEVLDRDDPRTLGAIRERLHAGGAFAILPDLRVRRRDVAVDFLGSQANVSHAGAMFAVRCSSPIVVAMMRREKGKHVFEHLATLRPDPTAADKRAEAVRLTREALRLMDEAIRRHPGEWYWYNKRWIHEPPTE